MHLFPCALYEGKIYSIYISSLSQLVGLVRGCLVFKKLLFITHHFITYHLSIKIPQLRKVACLTFVSNFDNLKNFTFCETHWLTWYNFYFFFSFLFFFQSPVPKFTESREKKEKEKRKQTQKPNVKKKKKK